ncbi:MAG: flavin reductase family protein [Tepidisphaeraceae bacterium]
MSILHRVPEALKNTVGKALGKVPSGVFILTTTDGAGQPVAMMASWVQQAAFEPPALSVAVARERPAYAALLQKGTAFALSVLAEHDSALMKKYARGIAPGVDPFDGVATKRTPGGATVLSDALAWLECRVLSACDFGADHAVFVAEITGGELMKEAASFTHTRGNGFHY